MRIDSVIVEGFGPFSGETLQFAPGMTIVFGPNESGKSSLHAATYAALCGMRRSRGQPRREEREFTERHRPWDGGPWKVRALLTLGDGRRIEISHDLDGRIDSRAVDLALNRDVSSEIICEGAPDGSRWLGFDRTSFAATACVRQAEIVQVLESAGALQDELQRAAASAGGDQTAAEAIDRLRRFRSQAVGTEVRHSTKPLRRALEREAQARRAHEEAIERHQEYLRTLAQLDDQARREEDARRTLALAEAAIARHEAVERRRRFERARELSHKHPQEPPAPVEDEELANAVAQALARWADAPPAPDTGGRTIVDLQRELAALPPPPDGDVLPDQEVLDAEAALAAVEERRRRHEADALPRAPGDPDELEVLADALAAVPGGSEQARVRVEELRAALERPRRLRRGAALAAALTLAGLVLAVVVGPLVGAVVAAAGLTGLLFDWLSSRSGATVPEALAAAERVLAEREEAERDRARAAARLEQLGLPVDPEAARAAARAARERRSWEQQLRELDAQREERRRALADALRARGVSPGEDPRAAVAVYRQACEARRKQERHAARRPDLERLVEALSKREEVVAQLVAVADRLGLPEREPSRIADSLRAWQERRAAELARLDTARQEWHELQLLLGGGALADLEREAELAQRRAEEAATGLDPIALAEVEADAARSRLPELRHAADDAARRSSQLRGQLEEMTREAPSVAEAEEELAAAQAELERVRDLEETLTTAIRFLEEAQARVHRTIAPILAETIRRWLPRVVVTREDGGGLVTRYDDVLIDPETLKVSARRADGPWRDASRLSHGTKEQIYLLLRVALAEHLTVKGETAPLLLDQITAQCDRYRRAAMLELLHELSRDRQVILFTHDDAVIEWAEAHVDLESGRDRLDVLTPVAVS